MELESLGAKRDASSKEVSCWTQVPADAKRAFCCASASFLFRAGAGCFDSPCIINLSSHQKQSFVTVVFKAPPCVSSLISSLRHWFLGLEGPCTSHAPTSPNPLATPHSCSHEGNLRHVCNRSFFNVAPHYGVRIMLNTDFELLASRQLMGAFIKRRKHNTEKYLMSGRVLSNLREQIQHSGKKLDAGAFLTCTRPRCQDGQHGANMACTQHANAVGILEERDELDRTFDVCVSVWFLKSRCFI